jgi:predicted nuclease of predicted toxin-antitoxin system
MKLLLDENLPIKLKYRFLEKEIETFTVADMKWNSKSNGELLKLMIENGFTHLVTLDNNLSFQQNFIKYPIPVIVIISPSNNYAIIMEIFDSIITVVKSSIVGSNSIVHPKNKT